jgi:hypothetical protein
MESQNRCQKKTMTFCHCFLGFSGSSAKGWGVYFFLDKKVPKNNYVEAPTLGNIQAR